MVPFFASGNIMVLIPNLLVCVINVSIIVSVFVAATLCFQFWQYYPSTDKNTQHLSNSQIAIPLLIESAAVQHHNLGVRSCQWWAGLVLVWV